MDRFIVDLSIVLARPTIGSKNSLWRWAGLMVHAGHEKQIGSQGIPLPNASEAALDALWGALSNLKRPVMLRIHLADSKTRELFGLILNGGDEFTQKERLERVLSLLETHEVEWDLNLPQFVERRLKRETVKASSPFLGEEKAVPERSGSTPGRRAKHGAPWEENDDQEIETRLLKGESLDAIAACMERSDGSIRARILHLYGDLFSQWVKEALRDQLVRTRSQEMSR